MKIVGFNGPPGSGKDTIAEAVGAELLSTYGANTVRYIKFAGVLKKAVSALFLLNDDDYMFYFETSEKDEVQDRFYGKKPRDLLISLSEEWFKPKFGKDIIGKIIQDEIDAMIPFSSNNDYVFITDVGFLDEISYYINEDKYNFTLVKLNRSGANYTGDSRDYIKDYGKMYTNDKLSVCVDEILKDIT